MKCTSYKKITKSIKLQVIFINISVNKEVYVYASLEVGENFLSPLSLLAKLPLCVYALAFTLPQK